MPADDDTTITKVEDETEAETPRAAADGRDRSLDQVILDYLAAQRGKAHLVLRSTGDHDFVYGQGASIRILAVDSHASSPQVGVKVAVLFKSTAEPRRVVLAEGETDQGGEFSVQATLPAFNGGTSAIVITASSALGGSEIKHLVHR